MLHRLRVLGITTKLMRKFLIEIFLFKSTISNYSWGLYFLIGFKDHIKPYKILNYNKAQLQNSGI